MSETAFHLLDEPLIPLHLEAAYLCISCQLSASTTLCILVRFKELNPLNCGQWRQVSRSLSGGTGRGKTGRRSSLQSAGSGCRGRVCGRSRSCALTGRASKTHTTVGFGNGHSVRLC